MKDWHWGTIVLGALVLLAVYLFLHHKNPLAILSTQRAGFVNPWTDLSETASGPGYYVPVEPYSGGIRGQF